MYLNVRNPIRRGEHFQDSCHWPRTRRVCAGVVMRSLDVRRVARAATARERRHSWAVRVAASLASRWKTWHFSLRWFSRRGADQGSASPLLAVDCANASL